jgi:putative tryptophan/tyrosine transport system substrate-binding protein
MWRPLQTALGLLLAASAAVAGPEGRVPVLVGGEGAAYEAAIEGMRASFDRQPDGEAWQLDRLGGGPAGIADAVRSLRGAPPRLVIALGEAAAHEAMHELSGVPVVAGMILTRSALADHPDATGVSLVFPVAVQLEWIRKLLPRARTVGVLFDPAENGENVRQAEPVAKRLGFELVARPIASPRDLSPALRALSNRIDVLWGLPDSVVLTAATAKTILSFSYESKVPLVAPSESWVKAGALFSLERDYEDVGRQCGELALQVLAGSPPRSLDTQPPRRVNWVINLRAARRLGVDVPDALLSGAQLVID